MTCRELIIRLLELNKLDEEIFIYDGRREEWEVCSELRMRYLYAFNRETREFDTSLRLGLD